MNLHYESDFDEDQIGVEDGILRLKKALSTCKEFGRAHKIWSDGFLNYVKIMTFVFDSTASDPDLYAALSMFYRGILQLLMCSNGKRPCSYWPSRSTPAQSRCSDQIHRISRFFTSFKGPRENL